MNTTCSLRTEGNNQPQQQFGMYEYIYLKHVHILEETFLHPAPISAVSTTVIK